MRGYRRKNLYERIPCPWLVMGFESTLPADSPKRSGEYSQQSLPMSSLVAAHSRKAELATLPPSSQLVEICAFTKDLFGVSPEFEVAVDPAEPEFPFVVATIAWTGDACELIQRRLAWHDRARALLPELALRLRLSILPS